MGRLVEEFHKLPGIGPKVAQRLTYYLVRMPEEEARSLAEAVLAVKERIVLCSRCLTTSPSQIPAGCAPTRAGTRPRSASSRRPWTFRALERTGAYKGLYHVLHGVISPMNGIGPDDLKIQPLLSRIKAGPVEEIILATNPNLEGEATAMYLHKLVSPLDLRVTRPARGLPVGGDLEYADEVTLGRAMEGRLEF